jgi:transposase
MFVPRQQYPRELKIALMREIDSGKSTAWVARNYQLSPKRLEVWKSEWRAKGELAFPGTGTRPQPKLDAERIAELERKIGQQAMEIDFLKKPYDVSGSEPCPSSAMALSALRANPRSQGSGGRGEPALPDSGCEPCGILPFPATTTRPTGGDGFA